MQNFKASTVDNQNLTDRINGDYQPQTDSEILQALEEITVHLLSRDFFKGRIYEGYDPETNQVRIRGNVNYLKKNGYVYSNVLHFFKGEIKSYKKLHWRIVEDSK